MADGSRPGPRVHAAVPGDYDAIAAVLDEWWGRPVGGYNGPGRDRVVFRRPL